VIIKFLLTETVLSDTLELTHRTDDIGQVMFPFYVRKKFEGGGFKLN